MTNTIEDEKDSLALETQALLNFEGVDHPKKIVKLAKRLHGQTKSAIQKKLYFNLSYAKDPVQRLDDYRRTVIDATDIIAQFLAEGNHGMIIESGLVYPVNLKTMKSWLEDGKEWDPSDEEEIQFKCAENWLVTHGKTHFLGKVVLFPEFGFTGVPRLVEIVGEYVKKKTKQR